MSTSTDQLWLVAEQEADNAEERNPGLWARCFAQAEGDASKASMNCNAAVSPDMWRSVCVETT